MHHEFVESLINSCQIKKRKKTLLLLNLIKDEYGDERVGLLPSARQDKRNGFLSCTTSCTTKITTISGRHLFPTLHLSGRVYRTIEAKCFPTTVMRVVCVVM